ncbi:MAG TPA: V4R domain-containing protein [Gemmatimonadaceae bacterium]|jgi:predicted hydrocarbon binding protein|nr:V4R domain-containing protein [Gemmatimonadaceae bacterium]
MPDTIDLPESGLVALTRNSLSALRAAMYRDLGTNAAALLQEAGYSGGEALYDAFGKWLAARGFGPPESLPATSFASRATEFFRDAGWGSVELGSLDSVATLDSSDWAESDPAYPLEFPGCYYTSGVMADLMSRLAGEPLAVMEVECRSMGAERCRFLIGSGETIQRVYDEMGEGLSYQEAVAAAHQAS